MSWRAIACGDDIQSIGGSRAVREAVNSGKKPVIAVPPPERAPDTCFFALIIGLAQTLRAGSGAICEGNERIARHCVVAPTQQRMNDQQSVRPLACH
jgi:hypothetical protein